MRKSIECLEIAINNIEEECRKFLTREQSQLPERKKRFSSSS